jgi:hypothetical protein
MADIHVSGRTYEFVPLDELTLDEAIVVWDYSQLSLDQIPELDGFHPGVIAALIHIAVQRGEPRETAQSIRRVVGAMKVSELETVFAGISEEVDDDAVPPSPATAPAGPKNDSGADSSATGAPAPVATEANGTGSPGSDTGATFDRLTSVV